MTDGNLEHIVRKEIIECRTLCQLCFSIKSVGCYWKKDERPDWISLDDQIGLEVTTAWSKKERQISDYKSPKDCTLEEVRKIKYEYEGIASFQCEDGEIFDYFLIAGTVRNPLIRGDRWHNITDDLKEKYDKAICVDANSYQENGIGSEVLNYQEQIIEEFKKKYSKISKKLYQIKNKKWLLIVCPDPSDTREEHLRPLLTEFQKIQCSEKLPKYDIVYVSFIFDTIVFDLNQSTITLYPTYMGPYYIDEDKVRNAVKNNPHYQLLDVVDDCGKNILLSFIVDDDILR